MTEMIKLNCNRCCFLNGNADRLHDDSKAENYCRAHQCRVNEDDCCKDFKAPTWITKKDIKAHEERLYQWENVIDEINRLDDFHKWGTKKQAVMKPVQEAKAKTVVDYPHRYHLFEGFPNNLKKF